MNSEIAASPRIFPAFSATTSDMDRPSQSQEPIIDFYIKYGATLILEINRFMTNFCLKVKGCSKFFDIHWNGIDPQWVKQVCSGEQSKNNKQFDTGKSLSEALIFCIN